VDGSVVSVGLRYELGAISVLVRRDLTRFFRQRSRVAGALIQPLLFWAILGFGLGGSFRMPGAESLSYLQYFFPGVVSMVVLFTSIFSTMSVIEDRREGFLQAVLVAPCSRASLVLGKTLGGVAVALAQAGLFVLLSPIAGFHPLQFNWPLLVANLVLISVALTATGFALAWWLNSVQGYHAIMSVLLIPAWILSGAMFPPGAASPALTAIMRCNPLAYSVSALRRGLYGVAGGAHASVAGVGGFGSTPLVELLVVAGFAALAMTWAIRRCARRE
jgi:daunorubicin resistance ABC transporter membrane protein